MDFTPDTMSGMTRLNLRDAPDTDIGQADESQRTTQVLQIELARDLVREMQQHAKSSKGIQLSFGKTPMLRYGTTSTLLHITPSRFRNEIYKRDSDESQDLRFKGLVSHTISMKKVEETTAGAETAMATLKAQMASYNQEKASNQTTFVEEVLAPKNNRKPGTFKKRPSHLQVRDITRSLPSSPALQATSPGFGPSSNHSAKAQAQRLTFLHLLAIGPTSESTILKKTAVTRHECSQLLEKFANQTGSHWKLGEKWFKELDIWRFPYPSSSDRQAAIDNSVRAFDRQRLSKEDKLWQLLLPKEERGKGKILSKLSLNGGHTPQPASTSGSGSIGAASDTSEKKLLSLPGSETMARLSSQDPVRSKKTIEKEAMSKRLFGNGKAAKSAGMVRAPVTKGKEKEREEMSTKSADLKSAKEVKGSAAKAGQKRKVDTKIKSAEFVEDSADEEDSAAPPAKRAKLTTAAAPPKSSPQVQASTGTFPANSWVNGKGIAAKSSSAFAASSTPKVLPVKRGSVGTAEKPKLLNELDRTKVTSSLTTTKPSAKAISRVENADGVAKKSAPGLAKKPLTAAPTTKQTQSGPLKQPPAPASASSGTSSTWFSSVTAASHRHSSSLSSVSSSTSATEKPDIQKRLVPVTSKIKTDQTIEPLRKKRKVDGSPAKPSSLGSSPPVNASDSENAPSVDFPTFNAADTPGIDLEMQGTTTEPLLGNDAQFTSSRPVLPSKLEFTSESPKDIKTKSLITMREEALAMFLQARMDADREYPDGFPNEVDEKIRSLQNTFFYLRREVKTKMSDSDSVNEDIPTLARSVPAGSAAYFQGKIHEIWPKYNHTYDKVAALSGKATEAHLMSLSKLHTDCEDLQKLYGAAARKDRYTQMTMCMNNRDPSDVPLSRRQTLDMYAHFHRNFAAYTTFSHELRALPTYPNLPPDKIDQDAKMYRRLFEMANDIFGGFEEIVRNFDKPTVGTVLLTDFAEGGIPSELETELEVWRMRSRFESWLGEYRAVKSKFGALKPEDMVALWRELDAIKVVERKLIAAVALDFGAKEKAELEDVSLEEFEPSNGSKMKA